MVKALKIEIFLLCMIVLIGLAARSRHSLFSSTQQLLFSTLGYTSAAYMLFDIIWTLSDGVGGTLGIAANWISNGVRFRSLPPRASFGLSIPRRCRVLAF